MDALFEDDFSGFPLGPLYEPYTALGEYHVPRTLRRFGRWTEATVYHGWRAPVWVVLEEGGKHVLEEVRLCPDHSPIFTCGDGFWEDIDVTLLLRPLSARKEVGVVFRYRDCRSFYVAGFREGEFFLGLRDHEEKRTFASEPLDYLDGGYVELCVSARGEELTAKALGRTLTVRDGRYARGKAGMIAECACRFSRLRVEGDAAAVASRRRSAEEELVREREGYPQPRLVKEFSLRDFGTSRQIRFGDLDGDGRKEILLGQTTFRASGDFAETNLLTALNLEGEVLWQIGEPSPSPDTAMADIAAQVADVDGDGRAEVVYVKDHFLRIADGRTGELKAEAPTPVQPGREGVSWYTEFTHGAADYHRAPGDAVALGRLRKETKGFDIILKDRYAHVWAFTAELELLWQRTLNTGHFPLVKDIDEDGLDEVFIGYSLLDSDGSLIYDLGLGDHVDGIACERLSGPEGEYRVALAAGEEGFILCDLRGKIIAKHMLGHVQKLSVGNFSPERPGLEVFSINYWGNPGICFYFDSEGSIIRTIEPVAYASPVEPVNWTGDGRALVFLSGHPEAGGLLDGHGRRVVTFPDDGHPWFCGASSDLLGDDRDEVVLWDYDRMAIYTPEGETAGARLRHYPERNMSNYRASVLVPWD